MNQPVASSAQPDPDSHRPLAPLFVAIVVVEILTIVALGWFGRHFS